MNRKQRIILEICIFFIVAVGIIMIFFVLSPLRLISKDKTSTNISKNIQETESTKYKKQIYIANTQLFIEVADTDLKREQGLSNSVRLENNQGMLFDFTNTKYTKPGFWMKQMLFDLDILWIKNNKVIAITKNIPHPNLNTKDSDLILYYPPSDIDKVLEVNSGFSDEHKIKIGDEIIY